MTRFGGLSSTDLSGIGGNATERNPRAASGVVLNDRMQQLGSGSKHKPDLIGDPRVEQQLSALAAEASRNGRRAQWAMGLRD